MRTMQLKLLTSNIRFQNDHDGLHSWENRKPLLQNIINQFLPDVLATQEGRELQIKSLAENLNLKLIEDHRKWINDRMYPCLFVNSDQIKVLKSGDIWLSKTPDISGSVSFQSTFPRLCTWMMATHLPSLEDYLFINTHLDHILPSTRISQIEVLINEIKKINLNNLPIILMGDFNESPNGEVRKKIINEFQLKDPWIERSLPEESTHHGFLGSSLSGERIDWILIPQSFSIENISLEKNSSNGIYPTDHFPVLATVIPR